MWNKFLGWYELNGKRTIMNVLLLLGVLVFIEPIKELLGKLPTDLLEIESSWKADTLWFFSGVGLFIWGWHYEVKSKFKFLNRFIISLGTILVYFFYFRNIESNGLITFSLTNWLYYFDIVIIAALSWWVSPLLRYYFGDLLIKSEEVVPVKPSDTVVTPFIEDIPTDNEDELQRESYAKTLAGKILKTTPKRAFNIGIFGEWGSGKSDFIHRIGKALREQDKKEVIIVEFNPWRVGSNNSITEDYLQVLSRYLRPYSSRLSNSIGDYAKQFIDKADTTGIVKSASNILADTFMPNADIESHYEAIKIEVSYLDTTIVVFIDDLDRLNKEEILETFKLIRNVADFPNTFFVLGLDRAYIKDTVLLNPKSNYLEKIFQTEVNLTKIPGNVYMDAVLERLEDYFASDEDREVIYKLFYQLSLNNKIFISFRQIKQFLNRFFLDVEARNDSVVKLDLLILHFLKEFYADDYNKFLYQNHTYSGEGDLENAEAHWQFELFMTGGESNEVAKLISNLEKSLSYKSNFYLYFGDSLYFQITKDFVYFLLNNITRDLIEDFVKFTRKSTFTQLRVYFLLQEIIKVNESLAANACILIITQAKTYLLLNDFIRKVPSLTNQSEKNKLFFEQFFPLTVGISFSDESIKHLLTVLISFKPKLDNRSYLIQIVDFYLIRGRSVLCLFNFLIYNIDDIRAVKLEIDQINRIRVYVKQFPNLFTFTDICSLVFRNKEFITDQQYFIMIDLLNQLFPDIKEFNEYFFKDLNETTKQIKELIINMLYSDRSKAKSTAEVIIDNRALFNTLRHSAKDNRIW